MGDEPHLSTGRPAPRPRRGVRACAGLRSARRARRFVCAGLVLVGAGAVALVVVGPALGSGAAVGGGVGPYAAPGQGPPIDTTAANRQIGGFGPTADTTTPQARKQRVQRREIFRGKDADQALAADHDANPGLLDHPLWTRPETQGGHRVARYLSSTNALVDYGAGKPRGVVQSPVPLLATPAGGDHPVPTDFALRKDGSGWTPRNPSVAVRLSDRAPGGYGFDDVGVTMRPLGLGDGDSRVLNDKLALLNAAPDTDVLAAGIPQGLETFTTLRSPASPESFSWQLDLPPGASLRARPTGDPSSVAAVEVVRGGQLLLSLTAPAAADAQGRSVPTTLSFAENTVTIAIAHRDKDFAYPITLDPQVVEGWSWIRDQHNNGFGFAPQYDYQTWAFASSNYGIFQWQEGNPQAPGLFQYQNGGTTRGGDWEEFYTNAGHPNTYIYEAIFADVNHYVQAPNYSFLVEGLWDIGAGTWQRGISSASGAATVWGDWASPTADGQTVYGQSVTHCATPACSPEDQPPSCANNPNQVCQNYAVLQEYYPWGGTQGGGNYMGSVALYIGQKAPPTTDPINAPGGWQRGTINIGAHARDNGGLGLASLMLSGNTGQLAQSVAPCMYITSYARGSHNDPCPQDLYGFSLDTTTMPDGYQPLYLNATNIAGRSDAQQQAALSVDNTPPSATITPALAPNVGQTVNIAGTAQDNASGVANWTAQVNGPATNGQWQTVCSTTTSQNSAYSCPWDTTTLPDGAYQVQVVTTDNAGNTSTTPAQNTTVHNTPPDITLDGTAYANQGQTLTTTTDLGYYAADHPDDGTGPGVASVEMTIDGQDSNPDVYLDNPGCSTGGCQQDDTFPIDPTQLNTGQHTVVITATDAIGNTAQQSFAITTDQGQAQAAQKADYTCPTASQTQSPPGTPATAAAATNQLQSNWVRLPRRDVEMPVFAGDWGAARSVGALISLRLGA